MKTKQLLEKDFALSLFLIYWRFASFHSHHWEKSTPAFKLHPDGAELPQPLHSSRLESCQFFTAVNNSVHVNCSDHFSVCKENPSNSPLTSNFRAPIKLRADRWSGMLVAEYRKILSNGKTSPNRLPERQTGASC